MITLSSTRKNYDGDHERGIDADIDGANAARVNADLDSTVGNETATNRVA